MTTTRLTTSTVPEATLYFWIVKSLVGDKRPMVSTSASSVVTVLLSWT
ncbi:hypothetical protein [Rhodococcus qingshengii]|nr:hypothetical protein [Rhodococcus qingshengii]MDJ0441411.1 hypothetical protein [Rhodococcus qingshengii]